MRQVGVEILKRAVGAQSVTAVMSFSVMWTGRQLPRLRAGHVDEPAVVTLEGNSHGRGRPVSVLRDYEVSLPGTG